jgi:hypothetical protein
MSHDNVLMPDDFNERFTIYLNAAGKPVQRTLRQMTGGEVIAALEWNQGEIDRLEVDAAPVRWMGEAIEAGRTDRLAEVAKDELLAAVAVLRALATAQMRHARLLSLVAVAIPQWRRHRGMGLSDALKRFWPHAV